jgi:perosamine synthetase
MAELAINGGTPIRTALFARYTPLGQEETNAVARVMESGRLSGFYGSYDIGYFGGPEIQAFEQEWAEYFGVRHAVSVNSATSGLLAAVGAAGIGPGDEVIVTPLSMSATATVIVFYGAVPVFADVEPEYFCLDPASVERCITPRTKAVMVTNLFGQPYDVDAIGRIADRHGLTVIEDNAQGPGALYKDRHAGTLGDMGVFSLNYHKHIHTGEGGVVCTDDDRLADRLRMIRNHAESVAAGRIVDEPDLELTNLIGLNLRLTEIQAAIGREQLKKLGGLVDAGARNADFLAAKLAEIPCIQPAAVRPDCTHVYYEHALLFDETVAGVPRDRFVEAVARELPATEGRETDGPLISAGYGIPLYRLPMYRRKIAFGEHGYPFTAPTFGGTINYDEGICPVAERLSDVELIVHEFIRPPATEADLDDVVAAFWKVWNNRSELL